MEDNKELSREQFGAITRSIKLGRTLQEDHPKIAEMYIHHTQSEIAKILEIQSKYGVSNEVALTGVRYAINGHEGSLGIEGYVGLITDEEELKRLREGRKVAGSQKGGRTTYEQGIGVHGRTAKQMSEDALKSTIARGRTPWTDEEKEFAYMLSQEQEYQHPNGSNNPGKPNNDLIAFILNAEYHDYKEVRSTGAVQVQLFKYRKSLDDMLLKQSLDCLVSFK